MFTPPRALEALSFGKPASEHITAIQCDAQGRDMPEAPGISSWNSHIPMNIDWCIPDELTEDPEF